MTLTVGVTAQLHFVEYPTRWPVTQINFYIRSNAPWDRSP